MVRNSSITGMSLGQALEHCPQPLLLARQRVAKQAQRGPELRLEGVPDVTTRLNAVRVDLSWNLGVARVAAA